MPVGTPVALDGLFSPGEWDLGLRQEFTDGGELFLIQDGCYLYLGIHENFDGLTATSVFMEYGSKISVFHASGSLGTATFEYADNKPNFSQGAWWPAELPDDSINIELLQGNVAEDSREPLQLQFAPETWASFSIP